MAKKIQISDERWQELPSKDLIYEARLLVEEYGSVRKTAESFGIDRDGILQVVGGSVPDKTTLALDCLGWRVRYDPFMKKKLLEKCIGGAR